MIHPKPMTGAWLLVLAVLFTLAGCSSKPERETGNGAGEAAQEQTKTDTQTRAPLERKFDAEGRLI
ncbi:MAG: hypothetical protein WCB63_14400, partial [Polyangiales bacterium]